MKKVFTVIFVVLVFISNAQEIVDSTKVWSILTGYCQPEYTVYTTEQFRFKNDTLIDGKMYKTIFISEDEQQEDWFFYGAFIREENQKVYYREYSGEEGLVYDFSLELGDTVVVHNPRAVSEVTLSLVEIDSVETTDGYRERWKLTNDAYEYPEYWIRGIGSEAGVINSTTGLFGGLCGTYILLCEQENDATVYLNPDFELCFYEELIVGKEEHVPNEEPIHIRYNGNERILDVTCQKAGEYSIIITGINGRRAYENRMNGQQARLSLENYHKGMYVVTVTTGRRRSATRKIMVY